MSQIADKIHFYQNESFSYLIVLTWISILARRLRYLCNDYKQEVNVMSVTKLELDKIKQQQEEFIDLVQESNRDELGQCAKLLAMYLTVYKQRYGDIPLEEYIQSDAGTAFEGDLSQLIQEGVKEATTMLNLVRDEKRENEQQLHYYPTSTTIN